MAKLPRSVVKGMEVYFKQAEKIIKQLEASGAFKQAEEITRLGEQWEALGVTTAIEEQAKVFERIGEVTKQWEALGVTTAIEEQANRVFEEMRLYQESLDELVREPPQPLPAVRHLEPISPLSSLNDRLRSMEERIEELEALLEQEASKEELDDPEPEDQDSEPEEPFGPN